MRLVCISFVFSFPLAFYAATQWLKNYPYRIEVNIWIFGLTALITTCIALFSVGWDTIRASMMNPVKSLKTE
jgi:putative ABC transport system permease protein